MISGSLKDQTALIILYFWIRDNHNSQIRSLTDCRLLFKSPAVKVGLVVHSIYSNFLRLNSQNSCRGFDLWCAGEGDFPCQIVNLRAFLKDCFEFRPSKFHRKCLGIDQNLYPGTEYALTLTVT